jgi:hypothetical protein
MASVDVGASSMSLISEWLSAETGCLVEEFFSMAMCVTFAVGACEGLGVDDKIDDDDDSGAALDVKSVTLTRRSRVGGLLLCGGFFMVIHTGAWSDALCIPP